MLGAGLAPGRFSDETLAFTRTTDQEHGERMGQAREEGATPMPATSCPSALVSPGRHASLRRAASASIGLTLARSPGDRGTGKEALLPECGRIAWKTLALRHDKES